MKKPDDKPPASDTGKSAIAIKREENEHATAFLAPTEVAMSKTVTPNTDNGRLRGRPATGKRSNPEWKLYSHFLRKQTQRAAVAKLQAEDGGRDLSDVLQELLENWLKT